MDKQQIDYAKFGQERIITISDLIIEIIRKLWLVIIFAVVFALLLGGYKYVKDSKAASSENEIVEISDLESDLSDADRTAVNNVLSVQDNLNQQQEYADSSVLMQINPYDESNVALQYHFDTEYVSQDESDLGDYSKDLLVSYQNYVNGGGLSSDLVSKGIDVDVQYINELISCTTDIDKLSGLNNGAFALETISNSFDIKVIHVDEKQCRELSEKIVECMEAYQKVLDESVGAHTLTLVDQSYSRVVDKTLWTYKYDRVNSIVAMQEKLDVLKEDLNASQLEVVEKSNKQYEEENNTDSDAEQESTVGISKKYVAVGGAAGIILACLLIVIYYIMRGTINKAEDLQYMYNMRILGQLTTSGKKGICSSVLNILPGRKNSRLSLEEQYALLAANLRAYCRKEQVKSLLLCGSSGVADAEGYFEKLASDLAEDGIQAEMIQNLLCSEMVFEKLDSIHHVILVEKLRASRYEEIGKELAVCMEQKAEIVGAVVLN